MKMSGYESEWWWELQIKNSKKYDNFLFICSSILIGKTIYVYYGWGKLYKEFIFIHINVLSGKYYVFLLDIIMKQKLKLNSLNN